MLREAFEKRDFHPRGLKSTYRPLSVDSLRSASGSRRAKSGRGYRAGLSFPSARKEEKGATFSADRGARVD
jgi:hypothetical protein